MSSFPKMPSLPTMPSSNTSSNNNHQVDTAAAMIMDQVERLKQDQEALQNVTALLQQAKASLQKQVKQNNAKRRELLRQETARCGLELELYNKQDKCESNQACIVKIQEEIKELQEQCNAVQESNANRTKQVYAPHLVEMELYQTSLEGRIQLVEKEKQLRLQRLAQLQHDIDGEQEQIRLAQEQTSLAKSEIATLLKEEEDQDDQASALDKSIKAALAKRSSLRNALEDAKESLQKTQDEALIWEEDFMDLDCQTNKHGTVYATCT